MKSIVKKAIRDEKGAALALTLVLLLVGGLIIAPLLGFMGTGLIAGQVHEKRMDELYAADAGVEEAVWRIQGGNVTPPHSCGDPDYWEYTISDVNGKKVEYTITYWDNLTYKIISTATSDSGSSTAVEAYIEVMVFDLFAGALVSSGDITFHKDCAITGDVYYVGEIGDYTHIDGEEIQISPDAFPTQEQNEAFAQQLKDEALVGGTHNGDMDIQSNTTLGSPDYISYINGNLDISKSVTITLAGIVYVRGYISCDQDLTITGTGSIVAEDYIYLRKLANYTVTGDSIIMSLYGNITLKKSDKIDELSINALIYAPNGTISFDKDMTVVGGVIGAEIEIDKEGSFTYVSKTSSFGFLFAVPYGAEIKSYSISQH